MQSNLSDIIIAWVRTVVPVLVGGLITWAVSHGLIADASVTGPLVEVVMLVITAAYYFLVRLLEKLNPVFGFLLGVPKTPTYTPPAPEVGVPQPPRHAAGPGQGVSGY